MHSRIIELSKEPIEKEDFLNESDYWDNGFIGNIADYVTDNTDRKEDIDWFAGYLKNKGVVKTYNEKKLKFGTNVKEKFFREAFESFKKKTEEMTFEEFSRGYSLKLYELKSLIEDKYAFYVHYEGCYYTLAHFMREYGEDGTVWYIGGTLDYHS